MTSRRNKHENDTGLSNDGTRNAGRYYNDGGIPNTVKTGVAIYKKYNLYHLLIHISNFSFLSIVFTSFLIMNLLFAFIYQIIGVEQLAGLRGVGYWEQFSQVFFFSCQTFTTVGYGGIHPIGFAASAVASLESLIGLLSFALITGLIYGRFSRPRAYIQFSKNALITPYKDGKAFMFRMAPYTNHILSNATVTVNMAYKEMDNGKLLNRFDELELEIKKINTFLLSWTIVHVINEDSPLFGLTLQQMNEKYVEFLIFVNAFDESFSNQVVRRQSYIPSEIVEGAKFIPMFAPNITNEKTVIDFAKLNKYEKVQLPSN